MKISKISEFERHFNFYLYYFCNIILLTSFFIFLIMFIIIYNPTYNLLILIPLIFSLSKNAYNFPKISLIFPFSFFQYYYYYIFAFLISEIFFLFYIPLNNISTVSNVFFSFLYSV